MATNNKSVIVTKAEKAEFVQFWEIQNMPLVFKSTKLMEEQMTELNTVYCMRGQQTVSCRWEVSLIKPYDSLAMQFEIVDINGEPGDMVDGSICVYYGSKADCSSFVQRTYVDKRTVRKGSKYILHSMYHNKWSQFMKAPNGNVTYRIELKFEKSPETISIMTYELGSVEENSQKKILDGLANICLSESDSDIKIVTMDGCELPAHSWILKLQNEVFSTRLNTDFQEKKTGIIKVDDLSWKTMKIILHYLYTGKLLDSWCEPDVAVEFTYAAGKYQLGDLLSFLDKTLGLIRNMDLSSCYMNLLSLTNNLKLGTWCSAAASITLLTRS